MTLAEVPDLDMAGVGGRRGTTIDVNDPEARQQLREDMMAAVRLTVALDAAINQAPDWRSAEAAADSLLPLVPESMRPAAESEAAERIVRMIVRQPSRTPADLDALGDYARTMTRLQSAEGDDVLRALIVLDGHWDDATRAYTARSAARRLGEVYTDKAECVGCTVEEALADMLPQKRQSLDPLLYEIQTVHRKLMRIARIGTR